MHHALLLRTVPTTPCRPPRLQSRAPPPPARLHHAPSSFLLRPTSAAMLIGGGGGEEGGGVKEAGRGAPAIKAARVTA